MDIKKAKLITEENIKAEVVVRDAQCNCACEDAESDGGGRLTRTAPAVIWNDCACQME